MAQGRFGAGVARLILALGLTLLLTIPALPAPAGAGRLDLSEPVVMRVAAVGEASDGTFVGSTAGITITVATNGTGHVFLDTFPLTEVDMQGSARLAARVASQISGKPLSGHDFFFVIRSGSQQIGGPSAGAAMAVGALVALNGWQVREDVVLTGTVQPDGSVGPVGGIPEKAQAAAQAGATRFLYPEGQDFFQSRTNPSQAVGLPDYCRTQLDIECLPVDHVERAVGLMTDHTIERPPLNGNVTGEAFRRTLEPQSALLLERSQGLLDEAEAALQRLPDGRDRTLLDGALGNARQTHAQAQSAARNGTFYTAASLSFSASIEAHRIRDTARFLASPEPQMELARILDEDRARVTQARRIVEDARAVTASAFETVGAAQVRILEAESRMANADAGLQSGRPDVALSESAYAAERAETATWWLDLGRHVEPGAAVSPDALAEMARDTLTISRETVAYVQAVLGATQVGEGIGPSLARLDEAEAAFERGFVPAAMLLALEAQVRASVLLELAGHQGVVPETKLENARIGAARAIQEARGRGVEPFLAQSGYEFGLSLENAAQRLVHLGVARVSANLAGLPGLEGQARPVESRFQSIPAPGVSPTWVPAAFAMGLALGVGAGLTALMPKDENEG